MIEIHLVNSVPGANPNDMNVDNLLNDLTKFNFYASKQSNKNKTLKQSENELKKEESMKECVWHNYDYRFYTR